MSNECDKRKRDDLNNTSSSDSSQLSLKRIKEALSFSESDLESDFDHCNIPATSTPFPVSTESTTAPKMSLLDDEARLATLLDNVVSRRLDKLRLDLKNDIVKELADKFDKDIETLRGEVLVVEDLNRSLTKRVEKLEKALKSQDNAHVRSILNDQYARRSHMVVNGLAERPQEDTAVRVTETIKQHLKLEVGRGDIEVSHRLGLPRADGPRPIGVVFRFRDLKWDVMKARKALKGTGIVFSEDLCKEMRDLFNDIKKHPNAESTWAWNGKLFAKDRANNVHVFKYGDDWKARLDRPPPPPPPP